MNSREKKENAIWFKSSVEMCWNEVSRWGNISLKQREIIVKFEVNREKLLIKLIRQDGINIEFSERKNANVGFFVSFLFLLL